MDAFNLFAKLTLDSSAFDAGLDKAKSAAVSVGDGLKSAMDIGIKAVAGATAAVGAFAVTSVNTGMDFDKSMSQVAATMGLSMDEMKSQIGSVDTAYGQFSGNLREYAQYMGANTAFSAKQSADALNYMALAGYSVQESMEMLPNVLNLAAAGDMELARASDMVTDTQTAFGLSMEQMPQLIDEMAKAASTGNTSVEQLGDAFLTVGGLAQELNGGFVYLADGTEQSVSGIQELEIALTAMANAGIKGTEAGTHMRNMLLKLSSPTSDGVKALDAMGVSVFDTEGKMRSLADVFVDLGNAMGTMTQEEKIQTISDLFNTRDIASAEALLKAVESDWDEIGASILDAEGAAQKMADVQLDNLAGDITLFQSALEGVQIALSDVLTPTIREFVQDATTGLSGITQAITNGDWSGAIDAISQFLTTALMRIVNGLPELVNAGMQLLGAVGQGILNNIPQIVNVAVQVVVALVDGLVKALPQLAQGAITLVTELAKALIDNGPILLESGLNLLEFVVNGIANGLPKLLNSGADMLSKIYTGFYNNLPKMITVAGTMINNVLQYILSNYPQFMQKGMEVLSNIANGILNNLPQIIEAITKVIAQLIATIVSNLPQILQQGIEIIGKLVAGLIQAIPQIVGAVPQLISAITDSFGKYDWGSIGKNLIDGIAKGISNAAGTIAEAARNAAKSAFDAAKKFLKIESPSKLMADGVGKYISEGIAVGIDQNVDSIMDSMDSIADMVSQPIEVGANVAGGGTTYDSNNNVVINVYGAQGQDINDLAEIISRKINAQVSRRGAVWA